MDHKWFAEDDDDDNTGDPRESAKAQIKAVMANASNAYFDRTKPGHSEAVERVQALFKIAYPA